MLNGDSTPSHAEAMQVLQALIITYSKTVVGNDQWSSFMT